MRNPLLSTLLIIMLPIFVCAGDGKTPGKNQIKFSPIKTIDFINPGLEFSYERQFNRFSPQLSYTFMKDITGISEYFNYHGNRFTLSAKYFLDETLKQRVYCGLDFIYSEVNYSAIRKFSVNHNAIDTLSSLEVYDDSITVFRNTKSFNFVFGIQGIYDWLVLEAYFGFGIKYKTVSHADRINESDYMYSPGPTATTLAENEGHYYTINFPVNIKIGFVF